MHSIQKDTINCGIYVSKFLENAINDEDNMIFLDTTENLDKIRSNISEKIRKFSITRNTFCCYCGYREKNYEKFIKCLKCLRFFHVNCNKSCIKKVNLTTSYYKKCMQCYFKDENS